MSLPIEPPVPIEEPTLIDIKGSIDKTHLDISEVKELIEALKEATARLESATKLIRDKTDKLPKEFTRAGATYRIR